MSYSLIHAALSLCVWAMRTDAELQQSKRLQITECTLALQGPNGLEVDQSLSCLEPQSVLRVAVPETVLYRVCALGTDGWTV
jgi:hypothetical protein